MLSLIDENLDMDININKRISHGLILYFGIALEEDWRTKIYSIFRCLINELTLSGVKESNTCGSNTVKERNMKCMKVY